MQFTQNSFSSGVPLALKPVLPLLYQCYLCPFFISNFCSSSSSDFQGETVEVISSLIAMRFICCPLIFISSAFIKFPWNGSSALRFRDTVIQLFLAHFPHVAVRILTQALLTSVSPQGLLVVTFAYCFRLTDSLTTLIHFFPPV